jgi:hypothetical protein
MLIN